MSSLAPRLAAQLLGFGGAPLGNLFAPIGDEESVALVRHAYERGVRYFDTAPHYGNGLSERRIGAALRGLPREDYVLSSKVGRILITDPDAPREQNGYVDVLPFVQRWDYSRDGTLRSIEDSLQRLDSSRLDVVYIHDIDRATHGEAQPLRFRQAMTGAVPALTELREQGVIDGFGLGVNDWQVCVEALDHADMDLLLLAGRYTLLDQTALPQLLPLCERRGVGIVVGGPYNSGILATGARPRDGSVPHFNYAPASPDMIARVAAMEALCAEFGVPLRAAALQFPRGHPAVVTVIPGARSIAELDENLALADWPIAAEFWQVLRERGLICAAAPLPSKS